MWSRVAKLVYLFWIRRRRSWRSSAKMWQHNRKWHSSSKTVVGLVCRHLSTSKVWELVLNYVKAFRYLGFLTQSRWSSYLNSCSKRLYVLNMGLLITSCNFVYQSDMYFAVVTDFIICYVAPESSYEFISRSYDCASSHTLEYQLQWPRSLNLFDSKSMDLRTEPCGRLFKRTKYNRVFRWHKMLGGNLPTSPTSITLFVLCLTCYITFKNQRNTLSSDFWAVAFKPTRSNGNIWRLRHQIQVSQRG